MAIGRPGDSPSLAVESIPADQVQRPTTKSRLARSVENQDLTVDAYIEDFRSGCHSMQLGRHCQHTIATTRKIRQDADVFEIGVVSACVSMSCLQVGEVFVAGAVLSDQL